MGHGGRGVLWGVGWDGGVSGAHILAPLCCQETQQIPTEEVQLQVLLSNGQKVEVSILTSDQTEDVLEVPDGWVLGPT